MILCSSVYINEIVYIFGNDELTTLLSQQLSDLLHLTGANVAEPDEDDLIILVEELETTLNNDLLFVTGLL
jgi:hypothetical protein